MASLSDEALFVCIPVGHQLSWSQNTGIVNMPQDYSSKGFDSSDPDAGKIANDG